MIEPLYSRRDFIKSSATAAAGLSLGMASLVAAPGASPEKPLRFGVIGTGKRALRAHLPTIRSLPGLAITGVCDVVEANLAAGLQAAGDGVRGYADYRKLLADPEIDAVMISTPNCFHSEMTIAALQANKHVICEKPMAVNLDECKAVRKAAAASDRVLLYTMQFHYSPYFKEMKRQILAGRIGTPRHMYCREYRGDWANIGWHYKDPATGQSRNWRLSQAASGGSLAEEGSHRFDIFHWMAGALPESVNCNGGIACYHDGRDTWDHATATLTYPGGCLATLDLCLFAPEELEFMIVGDKGTLHAQVDSHSLLFEPIGKGKGEEIALEDEIGHGGKRRGQGLETAVVLAYEDFADCIRHGKKPWMDADKAEAACKAAWLSELSARRKQEVSWNALG